MKDGTEWTKSTELWLRSPSGLLTPVTIPSLSMRAVIARLDSKPPDPDPPYRANFYPPSPWIGIETPIWATQYEWRPSPQHLFDGLDHTAVNYLHTSPGTQLQFSTQIRRRPCWKCRTYRRLLRRPLHWNCGRPIPTFRGLASEPGPDYYPTYQPEKQCSADS